MPPERWHILSKGLHKPGQKGDSYADQGEYRMKVHNDHVAKLLWTKVWLNRNRYSGKIDMANWSIGLKDVATLK